MTRVWIQDLVQSACQHDDGVDLGRQGSDSCLERLSNETREWTKRDEAQAVVKSACQRDEEVNPGR